MADVVITTVLDGIDEVNSDLKQLNKSMGKLPRTAVNITTRLESAGRAMQGFGKSMSLFVTAPLVAAGAAMFKMASDVQESENLFEVSMGNMAEDARDFSMKLRKDLGLNQFETRKQIGTLFQMTTAMGLGRDQAFEMSTGLTQLGNDMASFFNLQPEVAFEKIRAGITGEIEPLKSLGIVVDQVAVEQALLNAKLFDGTGKLTEQQKVMGRYLAIMNQTKNAQGDLSRTMDSAQNIIRRLQSRFSEMASTVGNALIPLFERLAKGVLFPLVNRMEELVDQFSQMDTRSRSLILIVTGLIVAAGPLLILFGTLLVSVKLLIAGLAGLGSALAFLPIAAVIAAVAAFIGKLNSITGILDPVIEKLRKFGTQVLNWLGEKLDFLAQKINGAAIEFPKLAAGINIVNASMGTSNGVMAAQAQLLSQLANQYIKVGETSNEVSERMLKNWQRNTVVTESFIKRLDDGFAEWFKRTEDLAKELVTVWGNTFNAATKTLAEFFTTGKLNFKSFVDQILNEIARFVARQAVLTFAKIAFGAATGGAGFAGGGLGSIISGFFQTGGSRVFASPSLIAVGETGAERVTVSPLGGGRDGGGGGVYQFIFQGPVVTNSVGIDQFADLVSRRLGQLERRRFGR